ncbi:MAG TPA: aminotransferase class I/II-fold pyridoxal phosphate-dependent enzyme, partial [Candidatus Eisenbacteria bacterium]|nr:aminotransferase class I/II-fold pyridoxal phosphate-dependent enzyme [Candidatus Eisenbacteria bacterium]
QALWHNCRRLREGLRRLGYLLGRSSSQILPVIVGDPEACMALSERLLERGIFAQGIRPPTVPPGTSRLRLTVMATHAPEHVDRALSVFEELKEHPATRFTKSAKG